MGKKVINRREFLVKSAWGAGALALSSCATLDGYFMGDSHDLTQEVVILGAGAAGLAAAFELKKRRIPFRVFEASSRVGGRVQTVSLGPNENLFAELGAEFIEHDHSYVFNLAKELNLSLEEVKLPSNLEPQIFHFSGRNYTMKDLLPRLKTLQAPLQRVRMDLFRNQEVVLSHQNAQRFERSSHYDALSLEDLLKQWSKDVDPLVLQVLRLQAEARFGVDAGDQSALHFLSTMDAEGSQLLSGRPLYRMRAGLSELTQTLAARIEGVIPDRILKLESPLLEIRESGGIYQLRFKQGNSTEVYRAKNIICTLPFSKLREVKGIGDLEWSDLKKSAIEKSTYASHSKGAVRFPKKFWQERRGALPANVGNISGDFISQRFWDETRQRKTEEGILAFQRVGKNGASAGANTVTEALADLRRFYSDVMTGEQSGSFINWQRREWAKGSMMYFKPTEYTKFKGVAAESESDGWFQFAGEHTSLRNAGTLEGAIASGVRAAQQVKIQPVLI